MASTVSTHLTVTYACKVTSSWLYVVI